MAKVRKKKKTKKKSKKKISRKAPSRKKVVKKARARKTKGAPENKMFPKDKVVDDFLDEDADNMGFESSEEWFEGYW